MGKAKKNLLMDHHMKVNLKKAKKMVMEFINGLMVRFTKDFLNLIIFKAKGIKYKLSLVNMCGQMEDLMKDNGKMEEWMGKELWNGLMVENMKDNIWMIKSMDMVYLSGVTCYD